LESFTTPPECRVINNFSDFFCSGVFNAPSRTSLDDEERELIDELFQSIKEQRKQNHHHRPAVLSPSKNKKGNLSSSSAAAANDEEAEILSVDDLLPFATEVLKISVYFVGKVMMMMIMMFFAFFAQLLF
jgi:hypothetical protein